MLQPRSVSQLQGVRGRKAADRPVRGGENVKGAHGVRGLCARKVRGSRKGVTSTTRLELRIGWSKF